MFNAMLQLRLSQSHVQFCELHLYVLKSLGEIRPPFVPSLPNTAIDILLFYWVFIALGTIQRQDWL